MKCLLTPSANSLSCWQRLITLAPPPEKIAKEIPQITESVAWRSRWMMVVFD